MKKEHGTLLYFTNSFPYGNAYQWPWNEIKIAQDAFENIEVFPYSNEGIKRETQIPLSANFHEPLLFNDDFKINFRSLKGLFGARCIFYWDEFIKEKVYRKRYWIKSWLLAIMKTEFLLKSVRYKYLAHQKDTGDCTLYFFWGNNQTLMIPFLKKLGFKKIAVRFHGFDLYKERLGGYQPFRSTLLENIDLALPISEYGKAYLKNQYRSSSEIVVSRLGTRHKGLSKTPNGHLKLVTCSRLIKLKRLDLIMDALKGLDYPIHWTIIGDGPEYEFLKDLADGLPQHINVDFTGWISSDKILDFYVKRAFHFFVLTSSSEGVPVSIMEAYSAGIPVMSTDVGGISEIVDSSTGVLLNPDIDSVSLAEEISAFWEKMQKSGEEFRNAAFMRFQEECDAKKNAKKLMELLKK